MPRGYILWLGVYDTMRDTPFGVFIRPLTHTEAPRGASSGLGGPMKVPIRANANSTFILTAVLA